MMGKYSISLLFVKVRTLNFRFFFQKRPSPFRVNQQGFTLIEILIAILILVIVLSMIYASYTTTFRIIKDAGDKNDTYAMARSAMVRIISDLGAISAYKGSFEFISHPYDELGETEFMGLSFGATSHVAFNNQDVPSGLAMIDYSIERDGEEYLLLRSDVLMAASNLDTPEEGFVICERLHSLKFKFYDDTGRGYDTWDSKSEVAGQKGMAPSMVSIYLSISNPSDKELPFYFMTKVFLPVNGREL
jgi:prepilin-type N-terminal cleavage/methylation domain-containing protein